MSERWKPDWGLLTRFSVCLHFFFLGEMFSSDQSDIKVLFLMNTGDIMTAYLDLSLVLVQPLPTCSSRLSSPADGGLSHLKCTLCFWEPIPKTVMKKNPVLKYCTGEMCETRLWVRWATTSFLARKTGGFSVLSYYRRKNIINKVVIYFIYILHFECELVKVYLWIAPFLKRWLVHNVLELSGWIQPLASFIWN